jgi:tRNA-modifying protein YgfZ
MSLPRPDVVAGIPDLAAARSGSVVAPLTHLGVLQFSGEDAESFLQGQLTCDVTNIKSLRSTYGAYCSPKGRMLANFLLWREDSGFLMALSRDIAAAIHKRISMFVLRSKVKVVDASDSIVLLGAAGPQADGALREVFGDVPHAPNELIRKDGVGSAMKLADGRHVLASKESTAPALRQRLAGALRPVEPRAWRWLDIRNGVPLVTAATQDRLVPQMANLEILGGVSFDKGCYTGQEIVARTQHLGRLKRRMFLANVAATAAAGDELYGEDLGDQAAGLVVNGEFSPDGGCDVLAVVQNESRERSIVHLGSLGGPMLRFLPLPYGAP